MGRTFWRFLAKIIWGYCGDTVGIIWLEHGDSMGRICGKIGMITSD